MRLIFFWSPAGETQTSQVQTVNRKSVLGQERGQNSSGLCSDSDLLGRPLPERDNAWNAVPRSSASGPSARPCSESGLQGRQASALVVTGDWCPGAETWDPSCIPTVPRDNAAVNRHT